MVHSQTREHVVAFRDITYKSGPSASAKHQLDLYAPESALPPRMRAHSHAHGHPADPAAQDTHEEAAPAGGARPVMLFVHGGGWKKGDRNYLLGLYGNVGKSFASQGIVTAVISYRLSWHMPQVVVFITSFYTAILSLLFHLVLGGAFFKTAAVAAVLFLVMNVIVALRRPEAPVHHPAHVEDCAFAYRWLLNNAARYGGDPSCVFLMGHSAGGHLVSLLSLDSKHVRTAGLDASSLSAVKGVISLSGVFSLDRLQSKVGADTFYLRPVFGPDPSKWRDAFPITHVHPEAPPFFLLNAGNEFNLELEYHTLDFAVALHKQGVRADTGIVASANHASIVQMVGTRAVPKLKSSASAALLTVGPSRSASTQFLAPSPTPHQGWSASAPPGSAAAYRSLSRSPSAFSVASARSSSSAQTVPPGLRFVKPSVTPRNIVVSARTLAGEFEAAASPTKGPPSPLPPKDHLPLICTAAEAPILSSGRSEHSPLLSAATVSRIGTDSECAPLTPEGTRRRHVRPISARGLDPKSSSPPRTDPPPADLGPKTLSLFTDQPRPAPSPIVTSSAPVSSSSGPSSVRQHAVQRAQLQLRSYHSSPSAAIAPIPEDPVEDEGSSLRAHTPQPPSRRAGNGPLLPAPGDAYSMLIPPDNSPRHMDAEHKAFDERAHISVSYVDSDGEGEGEGELEEEGAEDALSEGAATSVSAYSSATRVPPASLRDRLELDEVTRRVLEFMESVLA